MLSDKSVSHVSNLGVALNTCPDCGKWLVISKPILAGKEPQACECGWHTPEHK